MTFIRSVTPRFSQLDPAGILFFGEVFPLCAGVYEDFIGSLGFEWEEWFNHPETASPVKHAEAEYFRPLRGGQVYEVCVDILSLRTSGFEVEFALTQGETLHCRVRVVHVFISKATGTKTAIPVAVRAAFMRAGIRAESGVPFAAVSPAASAE